MKPKRSIKRRNRREGQIVKLAQTDPDAGIALALQSGPRPRTKLQQAVWLYLYNQELTKMPGAETTNPIGDEKVWPMNEPTYFLCTLFLDAVNKRDYAALQNMAREVKDYKRIEAGQGDEPRAHTLDIKSDLDRKCETTTLAQLRATLERRLGHHIPESTVRYLAKNLEVPLVKDTTGRPKKSAK